MEPLLPVTQLLDSDWLYPLNLRKADAYRLSRAQKVTVKIATVDRDAIKIGFPHSLGCTPKDRVYDRNSGYSTYWPRGIDP